MKQITLYRFKREEGGVSITPTEPNTEYTTLLRLVADENKALTKDGINHCLCIDVDNADGWEEVDIPDYMKEVI